MDARRVVEKLDKLNIEGKEEEAVSYLEFAFGEAEAERDERSMLTILSEMLGQYRRCKISDKGIDACNKAIEMVKAQSLENTAVGATVLINAATTMSAFGKSEDALDIFYKCENVYSKVLDKRDYRMSALYNNMASALKSAGEFEKAESYYNKALDFLANIENSDCDKAVTWCSLAELYEAAGKDESEINACMEKAWELLSTAREDSYLSYTITKCLGAFDYFGFFIYAMNLRKLKDKIDELYR